MTTKKTSKHTLEQSLKRLEDIVNQMEQGEVPLDKAVELYEEGIEIAKECAEKLKAADLKIKKLSKDINGQFNVSEMEEE
jgi:exodeoxyribonuclease VII small subunit